MNIHELSSVYNGLKALDGSEKAKAKPSENGFGSTLTGALQEVNRLQHTADQEIAGVALGTSDSVHQAIIAMEKASVAMQLTIQVRNKVVEAYQEIMRMQV